MLTPSASWPGASGVLAAEYTCSHGVQPGMASLVVEQANAASVSKFGTLTFTDGKTTVPLKDCRIDAGRLIDAQRNIMFTIFDRRWRWRYKTISGVYNQRDPITGAIKSDTKKKPRELVDLLMKALGEKNYGADKFPEIPERDWPAVDWDSAIAGIELENLIQPWGFRVVYRPVPNDVRLCKLGEGKGLPDGGEVQLAKAIDVPETPAKFVLKGRPYNYAVAILLEAVGVELNGEVKKIDDLSYKPAGGWGKCMPSSYPNLTVPEVIPGAGAALFPGIPGIKLAKATLKEYEALAREHVYRTYRITTKGPKGKSLRVPGYEQFIESIDQLILQNAVYTNDLSEAAGKQYTENAKVYGVYLPGEFNSYNLTDRKTQVDVGFSIDSSQGLVKFERPMIRMRPKAAANNASAESEAKPYEGTIPEGEVAPAWLVLVTSVQVRDDDLALQRFTHSIDGDKKNGEGELIVNREDVGLNYYREYNPTTWDVTVPKNELQIEKEQKKNAEMLLGLVKASFVEQATEERHYDHLEQIDPDGKIQQLTYSVGNTTTLTRASLNTEHQVYLPSFETRQVRERIKIIVGERYELK